MYTHNLGKLGPDSAASSFDGALRGRREPRFRPSLLDNSSLGWHFGSIIIIITIIILRLLLIIIMMMMIIIIIIISIDILTFGLWVCENRLYLYLVYAVALRA